MNTPEPAWSVPLRLDEIGRGTERRLVAGDEARGRIAEALGLEALKALEADVAIRPAPEGGVLSGRIHAEVVQICGVTLEPFETAIDADFEARFTTVAPEPPPPGEELGLSDLDAPDYIEGPTLDLGDYVVEELALEIDPYPRKPGVDFEPPAAETEPSPFDVLAKLRKDEPKE